MIRTIFAILVAAIYLILSIPLLLILKLIRKKSPVKAEKFLLHVVQGVFKAMLFCCGTQITVKGYDNIPEDEAVLFIGNHQSYFDVIISYSQMKNLTGFIAKESIRNIPMISGNMKFLHCLFLNRTDLKQGLETILKAIDYVKEGISIFIFPEGTRNKGDETELLEFHRGSFKIAQRTNCKIIPVSFNNTSAIFEQHVPFAKKAHVIVEYGTPILYSDLTKEEQKHIDEHFRDILTDMIKRNREEI